MPIMSLDHVNLQTARMEETKAFYRDVLGMRVGPPEGRTSPANWIWAEDGRPVIHLTDAGMTLDFLDAAGQPDASAHGTGQVHHVAFECADYDGFLARLTDSGHTLFFNDVPQVGLRQIFVRDPNDVLVELNFR